jgi:hypothetical protein
MNDGELASTPVTPPQSAQPSLEEWIARYGGRARIPWAEWDRAVEAWKAERRAEFERKKLLGRMQSARRNRRSNNGAACATFWQIDSQIARGVA